MRTIIAALSALLFSGCSVLSVAGTVVPTTVSVAGTVVETGVSVAGSAIRGVANTLSGKEEKEDKK